MEALWDSLVEEESDIESPAWHRDILEERRRKIDSGQAEFISLEKLRASRRSRPCEKSSYWGRSPTI